MRILHITEDRDGASGVATFVRELDAGLNDSGNSSQIVVIGETLPAGEWNILHIHGLWLPDYHRASQWAWRNGISVVWSTHGMTAPWSMRHKRWKKLPVWWLYQRPDLKRAAAIHCTTDLEVGWNETLGFSKCFVVPLGTSELVASCQSLVARDEKRLLFVGRIYPVKGLENLVKAWKRVWECGSEGVGEWKLRIVGPDQAGHLARLKDEVQKLGLEESVEFPGPKFGDDLSKEYDECDCLVLPSFTENFGATVVDALAHGKPCVASTFTPWRELQEKGCGWWVDNSPESLAKSIREMMDIGVVKRSEMGMRGRKWVEERYTWNVIVKAMISEYEKVLTM